MDRPHSAATVPNPRRTYSAVDQCIYGGSSASSQVALTNEHIIPLSLGGNLIPPKASCFRCLKHINRFETIMFEAMLQSARHHMAIVGSSGRAARLRCQSRRPRPRLGDCGARHRGLLRSGPGWPCWLCLMAGFGRCAGLPAGSLGAPPGAVDAAEGGAVGRRIASHIEICCGAFARGK
jgi:hypothetical protein